MGSSVSAMVLRLYVAGDSPASLQAEATLRELCQRIDGRVELQIVDIVREPLRSLKDGVLVIPTLVRVSPAPVRRIVGDLSERARVLAALEVRPDAS